MMAYGLDKGFDPIPIAVLPPSIEDDLKHLLEVHDVRYKEVRAVIQAEGIANRAANDRLQLALEQAILLLDKRNQELEQRMEVLSLTLSPLVRFVNFLKRLLRKK